MSDLRPPAELAWLTDEIGADAALLLMEQRGGTRVWVPPTFAEDMPLTQQLGVQAARAMVRRWGGQMIKIPQMKWWRARLYSARGMTYPQIALKLGCSETTVWRYLHPESRTASQLAFTFGEE